MKNKIVVITGSLGLIGYASTEYFLQKGYSVIGIDNNMRAKLFNIFTNYQSKRTYLQINYNNYLHSTKDIRNLKQLHELIKSHKKSIDLIIHTAAQTSHDWAVLDPHTDYSINASGTLNILELYRTHCPNAVFIYTSTNKVYGDLVNSFKYRKLKTRFDLVNTHDYYTGVDESFPIDQTKHSLFGVSKLSGDLLTQEYSRYFGLKTGVFRLGVVSGAGQNGSIYQGFLHYLLTNIKKRKLINIIGYKGKQVRDIIHPRDVAISFDMFYKKPKYNAVYNIGGGRDNSISVLELLYTLEKKYGYRSQRKYLSSRSGDHKWWITNYSKFVKDYPRWKITYSIEKIIQEVFDSIEL